MATTVSQPSILVDAHVHIHDCFCVPAALEAAAANFRATAVAEGTLDDYVGVLLLTETANSDWFMRTHSSLAQSSDHIGVSAEKWVFKSTGEACSLIAESVRGERLIVIAGRQIVAAERLEVLALGTAQFIADGAPIEQVVDVVTASGALAVVPWGFGKWWGRRGATMRQLLERDHGVSFFLGDNGGRPTFLPTPRHFKQAAARGIRILPGSDPLPFPTEYWRLGSFGFIVAGSLGERHAASDLKGLLRDEATPITSYGHLENPYRFVRNQFAMQVAKNRL